MIIYIAPVHGLKLEQKGTHMLLNEKGFYISNDIEMLRSEIWSWACLEKSIGYVSLKTLENCDTFLFLKADIDLPVDFVFNNFVSSLFSSTLFALWFQFDCSCYFSEIYFQYNNSTRSTGRVNTDLYFFNSEGETNKICLNNQDIQNWDDLAKKAKNNPQKPNMPEGYLVQKGTAIRGKIDFVDYTDKNIDRIMRARLFIIKARSESHMPLKIAFMIGALECLFTIDNVAVNEKIAQRSSHYLGGDKIAQNYTLIKNSYSVRSDFMHGQGLNKFKDNAKQKGLSSSLDKLLRQIYIKVVTQDKDIFLRPPTDKFRNEKGKSELIVDKLGLEPYLDSLVPPEERKY